MYNVLNLQYIQLNDMKYKSLNQTQNIYFLKIYFKINTLCLLTSKLNDIYLIYNI